MNDMLESCRAKSDQLNADDLIGGPLDATITKVDINLKREQACWVYVAQWPQPWKPSKTMRRLLVSVYGPDPAAYVGKTVRLFRRPEVTFSGKEVGGIQFSHASDITKTVRVSLQVSRGKKEEFVVNPLPNQAPPQPTGLTFKTIASDWKAARERAGLVADRDQFAAFIAELGLTPEHATKAAAWTTEQLDAALLAINLIGNEGGAA